MESISVVVCTHNRAYAIQDCLDSIEISFLLAAPLDAEIVVVNNASTDQTTEVVKSWAQTHSITVQLVDEPRKGLSVARNCGIRHATSDLLVFTDDDCRLSPTYIQELLVYDAADGAELVMRGGRVELGNPDDLPLSIKLADQPSSWSLKNKSAQHENLGDTLVGCNMVMRREMVETLGSFDECLGAGSSIPGGEDTDYIFRAYLAGMTIAYVPDMMVKHFHGRNSPLEGYNLFRNYALGWGALNIKYLLKHPNFCKQFYWDIKNCAREILSGKNLFMPSVNFSLKAKIYYCIIGSFRYAKGRLFRVFTRGRR